MQSQSMLPYLLCMGVAVVIPFILTVVVGKTRGIDKEAEAASVLQEKDALAEEALATENVDTILGTVQK